MENALLGKTTKYEGRPPKPKSATPAQKLIKIQYDNSLVQSETFVVPAGNWKMHPIRIFGSSENPLPQPVSAATVMVKY